MKNNFEDNILKKIKNKKIKPTSRLYFLAKDYWTLVSFIMLIILLAIGFGVITLFLLNTDWDIYKYTGKNIFSFAFSVVPYFWFIFLAILIPLAYINFRFTNEWYRYRTSIILWWVLSTFIILWTIVFATWLSDKIEKKLVDSSSFYANHSEMHMRNMWMMPDNWLIAWIITKTNANELEIKDLNGNIWITDISNVKIFDWVKNNIWDKVKIVGKTINNNKMIAEEIRSFEWVWCDMDYGFWDNNMNEMEEWGNMKWDNMEWNDSCNDGCWGN